jgi:hypothetical protein
MPSGGAGLNCQAHHPLTNGCCNNNFPSLSLNPKLEIPKAERKGFAQLLPLQFPFKDLPNKSGIGFALTEFHDLPLEEVQGGNFAVLEI